MIALTQIPNTEIFAVIAVLVFKLLNRRFFFYKQKRQKKLSKSRLRFKKNSKFHKEFPTRLQIVGMRNLQDT